MKTYKAVVIGCSRMGGFIDHEIVSDRSCVPPFSHAAVYTACSRTEFVGCSDLRTDVMAEFGRLYNLPPERQLVDYRQLIDREKPDIVSVATQPEQRAEIVIYAAEHGSRAIYAEKAMASSMEEADRMVEVVERHGVAFNLGTNPRQRAPRPPQPRADLCLYRVTSARRSPRASTSGGLQAETATGIRSEAAQVCLRAPGCPFKLAGAAPNTCLPPSAPAAAPRPR